MALIVGITKDLEESAFFLGAHGFETGFEMFQEGGAVAGVDVDADVEGHAGVCGGGGLGGGHFDVGWGSLEVGDRMKNWRRDTKSSNKVNVVGKGRGSRVYR